MSLWREKLPIVRQFRLETSLSLFIIAHVLFTQIAFQGPLTQYVLTQVDLTDTQGVSYFTSLQIAFFLLSTGVLYLIAVVSIVVLKLLCVATLMCNALALYFMTRYSITFDRSMIGNILHTDLQEASNLWHPSIILYVLFLGIVPAILVSKVKIAAHRWFTRVLGFLIALVLLAVSAYAFSNTWLWYDQHASQITRRLLPWSYIGNTVRYYYKQAMRNREQILLPNATFLSEAARKQVVVLVIGEAVRADHLTQYGYDRETNPYTKGLDLHVFNKGNACATNTLGAVACMVTHEGHSASALTSFEPIQSYLTRHNVETHVRTNNSGLPPVNVTHKESAGAIIARCDTESCPKTGDAALNWQLAEIIAQSSSDRIFITLHQKGSHGPGYWERYPEDFAHFTPVCQTVDLKSCSSEMLINAYDNTLRYTDYLLADIIHQLDQLEQVSSVMIYVADHGQSLGENGLYLHGIPIAFAPPEQYEIPFLVWMSENFAHDKELADKNIVTPETFPHDFVFHSIMGVFDMQSDIYKHKFDIFRTNSIK